MYGLLWHFTGHATMSVFVQTCTHTGFGLCEHKGQKVLTFVLLYVLLFVYIVRRQLLIARLVVVTARPVQH